MLFYVRWRFRLIYTSTVKYKLNIDYINIFIWLQKEIWS